MWHILYTTVSTKFTHTGQTKQNLEMRLKEHQEVCKWKMAEKLTVAACIGKLPLVKDIGAGSRKRTG